MSPEPSAPEIPPLAEDRLEARQAHFEREIARSNRNISRRPIARGVVAVLALAAVAAVVLSGRDGSPDALARAKAAVSQSPYLGVALEAARMPHSSLVHLDTHSVEQGDPRRELWFDTRKRGNAANAGGCLRLVGPQTQTGCISSIFGDATVAFTGALDHYRSALASGAVKKAGIVTIHGRRSWWLSVALPSATTNKGFTLRVAVDQKTGDPLRLETRKAGRVLTVENIKVIAKTTRLPAYLTAVTFSPPTTGLTPGRQHARSGATVTLADARKIVPGALWPGRIIADESLRRARVITLDDGKKQLELLYGTTCPDHCILIKQGYEAGWAPGSHIYQAVPDKIILVSGRSANGRDGELKIQLRGTDQTAILEATRALRPI